MLCLGTTCETLASFSGWDNQILIDAINLITVGREILRQPIGNLLPASLLRPQPLGAGGQALNNLTVRNLEADPIVNGARRVAFVSADDDGAKKQVETLLGGFGYSVIDLGNLRDGGLIQQAGGPLAGRDLFEQGERYK